MELKTYIVMGRSGCGKGTQIELLKQKLIEKTQKPVFHLEAGERFRRFIKEDYWASTLATDINNSGHLQPEFLSVWAWSEELVMNMRPNEHLIVDGTPRRLTEAKVFETALDFFERKNVEVILLDVSKEWSIERMKERHRIDDVPEGIKRRINWFDTDVIPVLEYLKNNSKYTFHTINGEQTIENVHAEILQKINL